MNEEILREIGLTDYEIKIYLALLEHGQISAYELAERTGLYRQAVYDAINRLIEKGYVNSVKEGKSNLYKAIDPEMILEYLNEKTESFKQIIPQLGSLQKKSAEKVIVETYKGKNAVRICLKDVVKELRKFGGVNLCTAVDEKKFEEKYKLVIDQYERDMLHYKLKEKVILKKGVKGILNSGTSTYRHIEEKFFNPNPTQIYGNTVSIIILGNPTHLIIIRSKEVADSYRKQFELLWRAAKA